MRRLLRRSEWLGALVLVVGLLVLAAAITRTVPFLGGEGGRIVHADFASTNELRTGDPVRVDGVKVGSIDAIERRGDRADVALRITDDGIALRRDASARIRWGTLLGGSLYVDLEPGSERVPADPGAPIPRSRTASQVEFDQLLEPFDGKTGPALRALLRGSREAFADTRAVGDTLRALPPSMDALRDGIAPLRGRRDDDLRALVAATSRTVDGLGRDAAALQALIDGAARTVRVTATQRADLGATIAQAPPSLAATRTTAHRIDRTLAQLDPLVGALRPGVRTLDPAVRRARPALTRAATLLHEARPLLRRLDPALVALRRASVSGRPLLDALDPTVARARDRLLPWLERRDASTGHRNVDMIGPTFGTAAWAASEFDGEGTWLHFPVLGDERTLMSAPCQTFFTDPSTTEKVRCDALEAVLDQLLGGDPR